MGIFMATKITFEDKDDSSSTRINIPRELSGIRSLSLRDRSIFDAMKKTSEPS